MVALTVNLSGCASHNSDKEVSEELRIGAILSLSGTYASMGQAQINALKLEVDALNAVGGVTGKKIKLIIEDDATSEAKAVSAASKLILRDKVEIILGATGTGSSMAIRQLCVENKIPQISMAGGSVITSELSSWVFQTPWPNELLLSELFAFLKSEGLVDVAFVSDSGGYGKDGAAVAAKLAKGSGINLVLETSFKPQDTDMSSQVALVKNSQADAIVLWNAGKEASLFVNQLRNAGVSIPLFGGSGMAREEFSQGVGVKGAGVTILTGKSFIPESWDRGSKEYLVNKDFERRFEEAYGTKLDIFAGHAFDALHLAITALNDEQVTKLEPSARGNELIEALERNTFTGYGGVFEFAPDNRNGLSASDIAFYHVDEKGAWAMGLPANFATGDPLNESSNLSNLTVATLRNAAFYVLIALGFLAVFMATGAINFAQGEFIALSGLIAAALVSGGAPLWLAFMLTLAIMTLFGLVFYRLLIAPLSKTSGTAIVIITVGASILLRQIALHIFGPDELSFAPFFGETQIHIGAFTVDFQTFLLVICALLAFSAFVIMLKKTRFGKAMRAYSTEKEGALYCGVNPDKIVGISFGLAAFFGALAGLLITPISQMSFDSGAALGVKGFSVAILGGLANPLATPFAALVLATLETLTGVLVSPVVKEVIAFIILILVLILRPQGLFGSKGKDKL